MARKLAEVFTQHEDKCSVFAAAPDAQLLRDLFKCLEESSGSEPAFLKAYAELLELDSLQSLCEAGAVNSTGFFQALLCEWNVCSVVHLSVVVCNSLAISTCTGPVCTRLRVGSDLFPARAQQNECLQVATSSCWRKRASWSRSGAKRAVWTALTCHQLMPTTDHRRKLRMHQTAVCCSNKRLQLRRLQRTISPWRKLVERPDCLPSKSCRPRTGSLLLWAAWQVSFLIDARCKVSQRHCTQRCSKRICASHLSTRIGQRRPRGLVSGCRRTTRLLCTSRRCTLWQRRLKWGLPRVYSGSHNNGRGSGRLRCLQRHQWRSRRRGHRGRCLFSRRLQFSRQCNT